MSFREGMRRLTMAFWWITAVPLFFINLSDNHWSAVGLGYAIGFVAVYAGIYWVLVAVIRWIYLGFAGPPKQQ